MDDLTFACADLTSFTGLDVLGLEAVGQARTETGWVLACRPTGTPEDAYCRACGAQARVRGSVVRILAHAPMGWTPVSLHVRLRRYACTGCKRVWRVDLAAAAEPRSRLSRAALRWGLEALVHEHMSVAAVARALAVTWNTANTAILAEGQRLLIEDPTRMDGVKVIGVDEHVWRHTRAGNRYVTVIIDLTPVRDQTGPARLLDMVEGRSKAVFKAWLDEQDTAFRNGIEVVAMDGFTGFKTAAAEAVPGAVEVMDPFHVVALADTAMDRCRQRIQREVTGRRGRTGDPLYGIRRVLPTDQAYLTDKQKARLDAVWAEPAHEPVLATWRVYQALLAAYRNPDRQAGKQALTDLIATIRTGQKAVHKEIITLARTLNRRRVDILAYFDHSHTSNGPTEAINGRLEHLRGIAMGFRNLTHYVARSLLESGGFRPHLHPRF